MDLIVYGSKLAGCYNPPLLKEGDGVLEAIPPCLKLLIGHSSSKLLSTSNIMASSRKGDLGIKARFCLLSIKGMFLPRGGLKGGHICLASCTLLPIVVVLGCRNPTFGRV